jgi:hypothetical protein
MELVITVDVDKEGIVDRRVWNDHLWREQGIREYGPHCCISLFINRLPNLLAAPS